MCGFTGFFNLPNLDNSKSRAELFSCIDKRGPDNNHYEVINNHFVLLFARLSIIDLSISGNQPMFSHSKNSSIVFNGEIYNKNEISQLVNAQTENSWVGYSDTEVLLEALELFGTKILSRIKGMYSFAYYNDLEKKLYLINDRFGEKPLYYSISDNNLFFSSDINSFKFKKRRINNLALKHFFKDNCIPGPLTIWSDVHKIMPSEIIEIKLDFSSIKIDKVSKSKYFNSRHPYEINKSQDSLDKSTDKLDTILTNAVEDQLISDVPIGCFLSGGIDSSLISAIASKINNKKLTTISIGFKSDNFSEAKYAKDIANYIKSDHHEKFLSSNETKEIIKNIPNIYGEPFSDSSQIPTILLSNFAKNFVSVALTGDGGDELFGGYERYMRVPAIWSVFKHIPKKIRLLILKTINLGTPYSISLVGFLLKLYPKFSKTLYLNTKIQNLVNSLDSDGPIELAKKLSEHFPLDSKKDILFNNNLYDKKDFYFENSSNTNIENLMLEDVDSYLPNDLLVKTDRAAMSVGLETRLPFLDTEVYKFSRQLPTNYKIKGSQSKVILKKLLEKYIPKKLFDRPKQGFVVPLHTILNDEIHWIENLLNDNKIKEQGVLNSVLVKNQLDKFRYGNQNNQYLLWDIIIFQQWYDFNENNID